jgi:hypothetical protein
VTDITRECDKVLFRDVSCFGTTGCDAPKLRQGSDSYHGRIKGAELLLKVPCGKKLSFCSASWCSLRFMAWKIYDQTANGPDARNMKCIAIANKQKQGGITYDELKYKRENCDLY